jgi:hypothetical protein
MEGSNCVRALNMHEQYRPAANEYRGLQSYDGLREILCPEMDV